MSVSAVIKELHSLANPAKAELLQGFFKTRKGEYAEGDRFLGITVPIQRTIVRKYSRLELKELKELISNEIHECRFTALQILVMKYEMADPKDKETIVRFYLKNRRRINNWDLVDSSASYILGNWLVNRDRSILYELAESKSLWDKRIAIISMQAFIRNSDFKDTLCLAEILLKDKHDLIHKAVGWMLREVGKRSEATLEKFLNKNHEVMPRTMLRYAIEKMSKGKRKHFMK